MEIATIRGVSNAPTVDAQTLEVAHYNLTFLGNAERREAGETCGVVVVVVRSFGILNYGS